MLIGSILLATAQRVPDAEAVVDGSRRWTYRQWNDEVNRVARGLSGRGLGVGDRVALSLTNRSELFVLLLAVQKIGAVAIPLNYRLTSSEIDVIAEDSAPSAWAFESATENALKQSIAVQNKLILWIGCDAGSSIASVAFDDLLGSESVEEPPEPAITPDDASLIMYTSGTTGRPKGVVLSHRAQFVNSLLMVAEFGLVPADRTLHIAPLYHVAAYHVIALPHIVVGGANILVRRYDPADVASVVEAENITNVLGAPTHFELWAARGRVPNGEALRKLKAVFLTGAPARPETIEWITTQLSPGLWNVYGQTEATSLLTLLPPDQVSRMGAINCIGRNVFGVQTKIVDPNGPIDPSAPEPEIGELVGKAPKHLTEYYKAPEKTAAKLESGWLRTGDLVRRDRDGYYYLLGRVDDLIITGGENVYPIEIEQIIAGIEDVADCAVVGIPDPVWGQLISAFVVPYNDVVLDIKAICSHVSSRLAEHKRPRRWAIIDVIPRNPSGKVILRSLRERSPELKSLADFQVTA